MMEVGVLIDLSGAPIYWHLPPDRDVAFLPDSRSLWDIIWSNRSNISGFAHSHPGLGIPGPSSEDISTFSAIERGLGQRLEWWITSADRLVVCSKPLLKISDNDKYHVHNWDINPPSWLDRLRELSRY